MNTFNNDDISDLEGGSLELIRSRSINLEEIGNNKDDELTKVVTELNDTELTKGIEAFESWNGVLSQMVNILYKKADVDGDGDCDSFKDSNNDNALYLGEKAEQNEEPLIGKK